MGDRTIAPTQLDQGGQVPLQGFRRLCDEVGQSTLRKALVPMSGGAEQLAKQGHSNGDVGLELGQGIELFVGTFDLSRKAQKLTEERRSATSVGFALISVASASMAS